MISSLNALLLVTLSLICSPSVTAEKENDTWAIKDTTNNSMNSSFHDSYTGCYIQFKAIYHVSGTVLAVIIVLTNMGVAFLFFRYKQVRKRLSNYFLVSLAFVDAVNGIGLMLVMAPHLHLQNVDCYTLYRLFNMHYFQSTDTIVNFCFLATIGHLLVLSSERMVSLFWALHYNRLVRRNRVMIVVAVLWITSMSLALFQLPWQYASDQVRKDFDQVFSLIFYGLFAAVPVGILATQYIMMYSLIKKLIRNCPNPQVVENSKKERRALIIYCMMFISFCVLVLPYFTIRALVEHVPNFYIPLTPEILEAIVLLRSSLSIVNPVTYSLNKGDFRKAIARMLKKNPVRKISAFANTACGNHRNRRLNTINDTPNKSMGNECDDRTEFLSMYTIGTDFDAGKNGSVDSVDV